MGKTKIRTDFKQFDAFVKNMNRLTEADLSEFYKEAIKEIALRFLRKVRKYTPSDTGDLRRQWTVGDVVQNGNTYSVEVFNPLEYALYVEKGHRGVAIPMSKPVKRSTKWRVMHTETHWTEGKFMMEISVEEVNAEVEKLIKNKLKKFIASKFKG